MEKFTMFIPLTKVDAAQRLVYGVATAEKPDRTKEICDYESSKPNYEKWSGEIAKASNGASLGNVRAMHGKVAAGKLTQILFNDAHKQIEVCAKIVDDNEWKKVEEGVYTGFSHGGSYAKRWRDTENPEFVRYTASPTEVSLVDLPCLPEATFQMVKADGAVETRHFKAPEPTVITNTDVVKRAEELAKAAGDAAKWPDHISVAREQLEKELKDAQAPIAQQASAAEAQTQVAKAAPSEEGAKEEAKAEPEVQQGWLAKDGSFHPTKAAALRKNVEADAKASAAATTAPVTAALDKLDKALGGAPVAKFTCALEKHEHASEEEAAACIKDVEGKLAKGEQVEGVRAEYMAKREVSQGERDKLAEEGKAMKDGSFPIAKVSDLENAIQAYGRAKNKTAAKRHIIKRARALNATDKLPDGWLKGAKKEKFAPDELKKNLWWISNLLQLFDQLCSMEDSYEYQAAVGDGDEALAAKFGALLVGLGDVVAEMLDHCLSYLKEEEAGEVMAMAANIDTLVKVGARHGKADQARIDKAHDLLVEAGAMCGTAKSEQTGDLAKVAGERDELKKTIGDMLPRIEALAKRVEELASQPMPAKGVVRVATMLKAQDVDNLGGGTAVQVPGATVEAALAALDKMSSEERAMFLVKAAHKNPVSYRG